MGSGTSTTTTALVHDENSGKYHPVATIETASGSYKSDGTLPNDFSFTQLQLRVCLDDPVFMQSFAEHLKRRGLLHEFLCWQDVQEFKTIPPGAGHFKRSTARHLFSKYLREGSIMFLAHFREDNHLTWISSLQETLNIAKVHQDVLQEDLFQLLQLFCFHRIHDHGYLSFKHTKVFHQIAKNFRNMTNKVRVEDFDLMELLGEGGFGVVVHARKKSTRRHYALKIQTKLSMLENYSDALNRLQDEKRALASCHHPFIVSMDYAFQTPTLTIMALQLATGK